MKPILHALTYAVIAASLVACGMNSGKTGTSGTAASVDTPRATASDKVVVNDETRMPTGERTATPPTSEDMVTASAVKERIAHDQTIDPRRITVQADRGTVYLNGSVDTRDQKIRAEQQAMQVAGVSSVVNRLRIGDERSAMREAGGTCTLASVIPATRSGSSFGAIELRVYNDIGSSLYGGPRDQESRHVASRRDGDIARGEQRRAVEDRPPDVSEVTPRVSVMPGETTPSGAGPTGGTMQSTAAQQGGTLEQNYRGDEDTRVNEASGTRTYRTYDDPRLSSQERARLYNEEARLSDRRGALIWSGWLKHGEKRDITSDRGPIRYDYRYAADDRFHDNKSAWCNNGNRVIVP